MKMKTIIAAAIIGCVGFTAQANIPSCAPRADLVQKLEDKYKENMLGGGLQNANELLEVWSSAETGSFTILVTNANGISCIVAAGKNFMAPVVTPAKEGIEG